MTKSDALIAAFQGTVRKARKLAIQKPENGAVFRLVQGVANQKVVCRVVGNTEGGRLWWFVDDRNAGETRGTQPFVWTPEQGPHRITCSSEDGVTDSVDVTVTMGDAPGQ